MCATCGCSEGAQATVSDPTTGRVHSIGTHEHQAHEHLDHTHGHDHDHDHDHGHEHTHGHDHNHVHDHWAEHGHAPDRAHGTTVTLLEEVLSKNNRLAERNRGWLEGRNILALNLVSSPGAGTSPTKHDG